MKVKATLEEMSVWSAEDVESQIHIHCPKDVAFDFSVKDGFYRVQFKRQEEEGQEQKDEDPEVLWAGSGFDKKIVLLDAYGWLWAQALSPRRATVWTRRGEVTPAKATRKANNIPDPDDLDPDKLDAVYAKTRTGK